MSIQPQLNLASLRDSCLHLRNLLEAHANSEADAATCLNELASLFKQIDEGKVTAPRDDAAPCGYYFHEGSLRKYPELESAYSKFSMALQGWDTSALKALMSKGKTV